MLSHSFFPAIGGIETISELLADAFHQASHEVVVMTWTKGDGQRDFPYPVIRNPNVFHLFKTHLWADLVFENNPCLRLSFPNLILNRPSVIGLHTWITRVNGDVEWQDKFKLKWLKRAKQVVACSNALRLRSWPAATVIANPYQEKIFRIKPEIPKILNFVFLGRLVSDKGVALAIRAFHQIISSEFYKEDLKHMLTLTIIGDGPERQRLEELVTKELRLDNQVTFKGALKGEMLVDELNKHRYLLVPSVWEEPFGVVVLEGMACGCIPIVSNSGGLPEAVGDAGLTFEKSNVESLIFVLKQILENQKLEQKLRN